MAKLAVFAAVLALFVCGALAACTFSFGNTNKDFSSTFGAEINFENTTAGFTYKVDLCGGPAPTGCSLPGVAYQFDPTGSCKTLGSGEPMMAIAVGDTYSLTFDKGTPYSNGQIRNVQFNMVCDKAAKPAVVVDAYETKPLYTIDVKTADACEGGPNPPGPDGPSSGGLSGGSIFCIVFFVTLAVYVGGGIALKKLVIQKDATGWDIFLNSGFWGAFFGNVWEGIRFTVCCGCRSGYQPVRT